MGYPFSTKETLVRNRWYIAAYSDEITREPMERTILGKPVAFYRKENGDVVAMYGICPHRYFPLAQGKVKGDALMCGYHGFVFDHDGQCIEIPSQGTGARFCQPTYPIEERGWLCWIWMGDADKCNPALIPPYEDFGLDQPGWHAGSYNYFHIEGRMQLLIDNLLDLTHLPYVHHHLPGGDSLAKTKNEDSERDGIFYFTRDTVSPWNPFFGMVYGKGAEFEGMARIENETAFYGPELIRTGLGFFRSIDGNENIPPELGPFHILHGMTPETEHSTHYFGFATRNFRIGDTSLDDFWLNSDNVVRGQDKIAIEAVEKRLEQSAAIQKEMLVRADAGAIKVRKRIQAMLDAEATQPA
ncbi:MAG: aromatic ring-hydroxylating dioxygenase subunit alpha [Hyphomonas sp.]